MLEIIAHLWGDYALQNHVMANRKKSSSLWAAIHVAFYTLPFLLLMLSPFPRYSLPWSPLALAIIAGTHFVIDRYSLAGYWVRFWGVGVPGWLPAWILRVNDSDLADPLPEPAPPFLAVWLAIIVDNTFHLTINHFALGL